MATWVAVLAVSSAANAQTASDAQTYLEAAETYRVQGKFDEALASLKKADAAAPNSLDVPYRMAVIYQTQGQWELSAQLMQDLLLMTGKLDGNYSQQDKNNRAIFLERLGIIYRDNNNERLAVEAFRNMRVFGDESANRGYQQVVETYRQYREWQLATETAKEAQQKFPDDRSLKILYAAELAETGQPEEGLRQVKALLKGTAEDREVYAALAQMYTRLKRWREADEVLDKALQLSATDADKEYVGFLRGARYEGEKKYAAAEEIFRKLLAKDPQNAAVLNFLGYLLAERGEKLDEALVMTKKAVGMEPANGAFLDSLGWVYYKLGQYQAAEANLIKASERQSRDPLMQVHLGQVYEKTGRLKLAAGCWERAIQEWKSSAPAEVDEEERAKVQHELEAAKLTLARAPAKAAPPPPKPAGEGPSLENTMQFIQDKLNGVGAVNFVSYVHDSIAGTDWTQQSRRAATRVLADASGCRIDYHAKAENNGTVGWDFDEWFYLKNVEDVVILPLDQEQKELNAAVGHPSWSSQVDPAVFVLKVRRKDLSKSNSFYFFDEQMANRVAKAMVHGVELCGGGGKPEPF
jgi:tetratricopeptide (TPR) repeat protein